MKINKLKINSYGKLKNKEINLENNINIIYGKNESGKSTILKFIINSFYGISKNKKGKEYSDFEKYLPWDNEEFSGKIEYELDNKEKYEIYRDFKKKNPQIYNENLEEISKKFNIDKNKGNEFFYEQTKVDEELFLTTIVVNQQEVKLEKQEQNMLIQKIANLVATGDDNVSYKRAVDRINRRQLDEIGTERSREKPINILNKKINELKQEKEELKKYETIKYEIEENKNKLNIEINNLENKNELLKEIKILNEKEKIEQEKIKLKKEIKIENNEKINSIKNKINEIEKNNEKIINENLNIEKNNKKINKEKNKLNKKIILINILIILINIFQFIFIKNKLFNFIFLLTVPTVIIYSIILKNKLNKKIIKIENEEKNNKNILENINLEINNLKNQINLIENNNLNLDKEINEFNNNFYFKNNLEKEKIKNKYKNIIEINKLLNSENINLEIENIQNIINNKKIKLHTLELDKKNIEPQINNLSKIEEELLNNIEIYNSLKNLEKSMNLAKNILASAYEEMKTTVTPKFTQNMSKNISEITNGKYKNVVLNTENNIMVELENGNYENISKLSVGTIDQLYLSLRLSMVEELSDQKMPIILDEAFAYYDTERLKNILKYINNRFKEHQIIIFTCTNREKEILEEEKIKNNYIKL